MLHVFGETDDLGTAGQRGLEDRVQRQLRAVEGDRVARLDSAAAA